MKARAITQSTVKQTTRPASDTKAHWREIVADANTHGEVFVTHYNRPQVVVVSLDRYSKLKAEAVANDPLTKLRAEFDRELAWLREPGAADKMQKLFVAGTDEITLAANEALSRRKS